MQCRRPRRKQTMANVIVAASIGYVSTISLLPFEPYGRAPTDIKADHGKKEGTILWTRLRSCKRGTNNLKI